MTTAVGKSAGVSISHGIYTWSSHSAVGVTYVWLHINAGGESSQLKAALAGTKTRIVYVQVKTDS